MRVAEDMNQASYPAKCYSACLQVEPTTEVTALDADRLALSLAPPLEKNVEFLNDCLDDVQARHTCRFQRSHAAIIDASDQHQSNDLCLAPCRPLVGSPWFQCTADCW